MFNFTEITTGTEKQNKWASAIKLAHTSKLEPFINNMCKDTTIPPELKTTIENAINSKDHNFWIDIETKGTILTAHKMLMLISKGEF